MWDGTGERPSTFNDHRITYSINKYTELDVSFEWDNADGWKHCCKLRDTLTNNILAVRCSPGIHSPQTLPDTILEICQNLETGVILRFTDICKSGRVIKAKELDTCTGDLYVIINALRDYANLLEGAISEWNLTGYHAATYQLHAARCRKIARKYAGAIGYDYDKAVERCEKPRIKGNHDKDTGMDGESSACH